MDGYTSNSDPALAPGGALARRAGPGRFTVIPVPGVDGIAFNTKRPLFRQGRMRRAVNFALDRRTLAGVFDERPTDRYIPPAVPGFRAGHVYPLDGPDLARARRLAGPGRHNAVLYVCGDPENVRIAQIVRANLAQVGIDVRVDQSLGCLHGPEPRKIAAADMQLITILDPEPDPSVWIKAMLGSAYGASGYWGTAAYRRRIDGAQTLSGAARIAEFARLDQALVHDVAPFAAYGAFTTSEYFSPRVGCKVFQSTYHFVDLGTLCVRPRSSR
jgi:hypothetical protein